MIAVGVEALDHRAALAADDVEQHRLARGFELFGLLARGADDVGVERAGQPAVAGGDDDQVALVAAGAGDELGALRADGDARREAGDTTSDRRVA